MIRVKFLVTSDLIIVVAARVLRFRIRKKLSKASVRAEMRSYLEQYAYTRLDEDLAELSLDYPHFKELKKQAEDFERRFGWELK